MPAAWPVKVLSCTKFGSMTIWTKTSGENAMICPLLLAVQTSPAVFDAIAAAPKSHRVLLEDERIRVLRVEVAPGMSEPVHDHRWPSVMYFEQPQPITYITYKLIDGKPVEMERLNAPAFAKSQTVKGEPEGLHAVTNRGSMPFVAIRIEFKDGALP
jgi:predicted metal-dependent enzyme (double-stranded beta helix superfamily)